ncbi:MAG: hypothetical protein PHO10_01560 [Gemmiger sp.]|nr:hypothetical protein [Gemmiger sp.]
MLRNELPPVIIPFAQRADYMGMLAEQNAPALAGLLKAQSAVEQERITSILHAPVVEP